MVERRAVNSGDLGSSPKWGAQYVGWTGEVPA